MLKLLNIFNIPIVPEIAAQHHDVYAADFNFEIDYYWNDVSSSWSMDIKIIETGHEFKGIVLRHNIDLFEPFSIDDAVGYMYVIKNTATSEQINFYNMGTDYSLIFIPGKAENNV